MIVLDTTVLVYAKGAAHALREPCRELVEATAGGQLEATTTAEVIQEFTHVRARRRGRDDAATLGREFADLLSPLLVLEEGHLRDGLDIYRHSGRVGAFDCILAAAVADSPAEYLVSADGAFAEIDRISHLDPTEALKLIE